MLKRLLGIVSIGLGLLAGSAHAQLNCTIENNFGGTFVGQTGNHTITVGPGQSGTLRAASCPGVNSYNWSPGNAQTSSIFVTAPVTGSAAYTLTGCSTSTQQCGSPVTITLLVAQLPPPDCTLTASPNPATSGQTVTFTATCSPTTRPAASIAYVDLSGVSRVSTSLTFTDIAPVVTTPTVRTVDYHGTAADGTAGPLRSLQVTINPVSTVRQPSQCTLTADPNPVTLGSSTRLTAACAAGDPVTGYRFSVAGGTIQDGASNSVNVTPTALGAVQYLVTAFNAGGSQEATATVTVVPTAPSGCTLTASPNPVLAGGSTTLTAQCSGGGAPTGYRFTAPDGSAVAQTSPTLVVRTQSPGSLVYSVTASNAGGASQVAQTTIVVQAATCTVTPSTPNPVPRGSTLTLTANCNNDATAYGWSTPNGTIVGNVNQQTITVVANASSVYGVSGSNLSTGVTAGGSYNVVVVGATSITALTVAPISGTPGRPISKTLQVRVADAQGNPVNNESVTWSVVAPGASPGTFAANPTLANAQGIASNTFTYGSDAGGRMLRACLTTLPAQCVDFAVTPGASQVSAVITTPLTGTPGRPLSGELIARVSDASGTPIAGELVNWSVVNPGASPGAFGANQTGPTDLQGLTRNTFTLGNDTGPRTLRACLVSLPTACADFPVSVTTASGLVVIAGSPLVGTPNRPLTRPVQVRATNTQGQPVAGELVNWSVVNPTPGAGTFASPQTGPTDATGLTQNTFTLGSDAGARTLRACLASQPGVCVDIQVQSIAAVVEGPTTKIVTPLAELAIATPLTQLQNIRFRLDQIRLRRNPSVVEALRVRVAGQSLPSWNAFALAPKANDSASGNAAQKGMPLAGERGGGAAADDPFERLGFFVNGELELGSQSATTNQRGFDLRTHGLTAGVDYRLPSDSVVGVAIGMMNAKTDLNDGGGSQGARGYSLSAYGSFTPLQGAYLDVIAHAGGNKYDTRRREIGSLGQGLDYTADTRGDQFALAVTAGADISRGAMTINPYARVDYVHAKINGFSEAGDAGAIKVDDLTLKTTIVTLGGQVSYAMSTSWGVFSPNARLELQRRVQGSGRIVGAQLVADGTISSQVALETVDRDYGNASIGFSAVLPRGISGFANWERLFGRQGYSNSKFTVGLRFEF